MMLSHGLMRTPKFSRPLAFQGKGVHTSCSVLPCISRLPAFLLWNLSGMYRSVRVCCSWALLVPQNHTRQEQRTKSILRCRVQLRS